MHKQQLFYQPSTHLTNAKKCKSKQKWLDKEYHDARMCHMILNVDKDKETYQKLKKREKYKKIVTNSICSMH